MKTACVIGATGLVGSCLVNELIQSNHYSKVYLLVRKNIELSHEKIEQLVIDFENIDPQQIIGDDMYCAIGTTLKKAGSKENQYKIDCEYPYALAKLAKQNNFSQFILVSSLGADAASKNFYLRTKGDLEKKISTLNFKSVIIVRPSFILGNRKEFRLGEKIAIVFAKLLSPLFVGGLKKYKGVEATAIAKTMVRCANENSAGKQIIESDKIY